MTSASVALLVAVFVACVVESTEAATVVMAMGFTRGWRSAWTGVALGLALLTVFTAATGYALTTWLPRSLLQLIVGALLLIFGLQWLRKSILRSAGRADLHDEEAIYAQHESDAAAAGKRDGQLDRFGVFIAFKSTFLEGVEVVFIVLTFGLNAHNLPLAVAGAIAAAMVVVITCVLVRRPLSMIPENSMKYGVGLLLSTFGLFWSIEGMGLVRPGHASVIFPGADWAILYLLGCLFLITRGLTVLLTRLTSGQRVMEVAR